MEGHTMSLEENKAIASRFYEGYSTGDLNTIFELVAPDVVWYDPSGHVAVLHQWKLIDALLLQAFPDLTVKVHDQLAEGDRVVTHTTLIGHHRGEFRGVLPTGKLVSVRAINFDRITDGLIVEHWVATYSPSILQQLKD